MACPASWRRIFRHHSGRAALDLEHLGSFELLEPRVGQIERNGDARHTVGREPFGR